MKRTPVESSNIQSVGYDIDTKVLEVKFKRGGVYRYLQVPEIVYLGLMDATSHGKYLEAHVKGTYHYTKVG